MGGGIAYDVKRIFPAMYDEYHELCINKKLGPGDFFCSSQKLNKAPISVYNLMTQSGLNGADIQFIRTAFERMFDDANRKGIKTIYIPMIGAGLGGISPTVCFNIYLETVEKFNGRLNVIVQYAERVKPHPIIDDNNDPRNMYKRAKEAAEKEALAKQVADIVEKNSNENK
jgi:O-acetyl-ADP-ribose deacetylase (regulator of RNase III)